MHIGDLVEVHAKVIYTGNTSLHVAVDDGKPVPVPSWTPQAKEDVALQDYAQRLMDLRRGIEEEKRQYLS